MAAPEAPILPPKAAKSPERLQQSVTIMVALIAATGAVAGFLSARESGRAGGEARVGLIAQTQASEQYIQVGRILDADFDYISEAEILAFTATEYDAAGLTDEADRARVLSVYLLTSTYGYGTYYTDTMIDDAVYGYATLGFDAIWAGYDQFRTDLYAEADAAQAEADQHFENATYAGRKGDGFLLSVLFMTTAAALGAVALATKSARLKLVDMAVVVSLFAVGLGNLLYTLLL